MREDYRNPSSLTVPAEFRRDNTLVLMAHIDMATTVFPVGINGEGEGGGATVTGGDLCRNTSRCDLSSGTVEVWFGL